MKITNHRFLLKISVLLAIFAACMLAAMHYYKKTTNVAKPKENEQLLSLASFVPVAQDVTVMRHYIGQVQAINQVEITAQISGYVEKINVVGGDQVLQNDELFIIEQAPYKAALDAAVADKFSAQAAMINAKNQYLRLQNAGQQAVSASELDSAFAQYLEAIGTYEQACAALEKSQIDFEHTILRAPFSGVVGNIDISVGDYISPQVDTLVNVVQYSPIRVVFSVTDKEYLQNKNSGLIFADDIIKLQLSNGEIYEQIGKVKYTSNVLNSKTDSLAVYSEFENKNRKLLPNAYVDVIVEKIYQNALQVDKSLINMSENENYLYVICNGIIKTKKVQILAENGNYYVLKNDFSPSDLIISQKIEPRYLGQKAVANLKNSGEN